MIDYITSMEVLSVLLTVITLIISVVSLIKAKLSREIELKIKTSENIYEIRGPAWIVKKELENIQMRMFDERIRKATESAEQKTLHWDNISEEPEFVNMIGELKSIMASLVGTDDIWFILKVLDGEFVKTVYTSRNDEVSAGELKTPLALQYQSDFNSIVNGDEYFFSSNMKEYEAYTNQNPEWNRWYNASVVVPITINGNIKGFFCMNSLKAFKRIDTSEAVLNLMKRTASYIASIVKE